MSTTMAWYRDGGPVMHLIAAVGLIGLAIFVERLYLIVVKSKPNRRRFIERVIQLVRSGRIDEAIKECAGSAAVLPDIGLLILRSRSRDEADLQNVADAASLAVLPTLTKRLGYLHAFAITILLLGLFGTAYELQAVFASVGGIAGGDRTAALLAGMAAALNPATFALIIAAALVIGRAYLASQSDSIIEQVQEFSARLINALIDRPDVRLGHR
jgi:biopolymer transport protein ExbB/TolQ